MLSDEVTATLGRFMPAKHMRLRLKHISTHNVLLVWLDKASRSGPIREYSHMVLGPRCIQAMLKCMDIGVQEGGMGLFGRINGLTVTCPYPPNTNRPFLTRAVNVSRQLIQILSLVRAVW